MSFTRQLRIVEALAAAQQKTAEALRLMVEERLGAPETPVTSRPQHHTGRFDAEPDAEGVVPTLSTNHADPVDVRRSTRFSPVATAKHVLGEIQRLVEQATTQEQMDEALRMGQRLVDTKLVSQEALDEIFEVRYIESRPAPPR